MTLKKSIPVRASDATGTGNKISSAAIHPEYNPAIVIVQRLQRACRVSEYHAATIARLANLGPREGL